ncbi:MAG TPA: winged helix-turn-helix domain-containing protein [Terracidiphilus sp.]|jgi:DNA-binding winged helix-turn-helix (wHTH) protein/Tfp pilus assembly protein PilF
MATPAHRGLVYRFGVFEVSVESREIFRRGHRVKLQEQPFQLLLLLLESAGSTVDREQIRQRLWPEDTFVDFGQCLGTALTKLRQALGDDANNPRFIETRPRHGYRFIAPVTPVNGPESPVLGAGYEQNGHSDGPRDGQRPAGPEPGQSSAEAKTKPGLRSRRMIAWSGAFAGLALVVGMAVLGRHEYLSRHRFILASSDTIVLADFENTTGETIFNDTLRQGLLVGLAQSPLIHVLSDRSAAVIFKQMGHPPDDRITGRAALELCRRVGGKVAIQGSISSLGTTYLVGLAAIRCDTGKPIANEQVEASQREDVIDALGKATSQLRGRLGESLPSIQKYNAPLEQATTPSLEALNAYGKALSTWDAQGDMASVPYFQKAIDLDPKFAAAYGALATVYSNLGRDELAREDSAKAYSLRDRVTEWERGSIDARYYLYVTQELDKAARVYEDLARDYPDNAGSFNHLGTIDQRLGRDDQAVDAFRKAIALDATRATTYANLAASLIELNRLQEAAPVLEAADKRGLRTDYLLQVGYRLAFLKGDQPGMDRLVRDAADVRGAQSLMLFEEANVEAYYGHLEKAADLTRSAAAQALRDGDKESAADGLAEEAINAAEVGSIAEARELWGEARKIDNNQEVAILGAVISALSGEPKQAMGVAGTLDKQFPHGTAIQNYWLPIIRSKVELERGRTARASDLPQVAGSLIPVAADELSLSTVYPSYLRGQVYLSRGDGQRAGEEFQKLLDEPGKTKGVLLGALARLERARAYSVAGDSAHAGDAYRQFLELWKDADAGIPILRQARSEAEAIHRGQ